jgi:hypothetical protein
VPGSDAAPPEYRQCPICEGVYEHDAGCPLRELSITRAARLGRTKALAEVKRLQNREGEGT